MWVFARPDLADSWPQSSQLAGKILGVELGVRSVTTIFFECNSVSVLLTILG